MVWRTRATQCEFRKSCFELNVNKIVLMRAAQMDGNSPRQWWAPSLASAPWNPASDNLFGKEFSTTSASVENAWKRIALDDVLDAPPGGALTRAWQRSMASKHWMIDWSAGEPSWFVESYAWNKDCRSAFFNFGNFGHLGNKWGRTFVRQPRISKNSANWSRMPSAILIAAVAVLRGTVNSNARRNEWMGAARWTVFPNLVRIDSAVLAFLFEEWSTKMLGPGLFYQCIITNYNKIETISECRYEFARSKKSEWPSLTSKWI